MSNNMEERILLSLGNVRDKRFFTTGYWVMAVTENRMYLVEMERLPGGITSFLLFPFMSPSHIEEAKLFSGENLDALLKRGGRHLVLEKNNFRAVTLEKGLFFDKVFILKDHQLMKFIITKSQYNKLQEIIKN